MFKKGLQLKVGKVSSGEGGAGDRERSLSLLMAF